MPKSSRTDSVRISRCTTGFLVETPATGDRHMVVGSHAVETFDLAVFKAAELMDICVSLVEVEAGNGPEHD